MTEQLDKTTLTRLAWLTELRRQGHRKCEGEYSQGSHVCALGLLLEVAKLPPRDDVEWLMSHAGMTEAQGREVVAMNDGLMTEKPNEYHVYCKHTFSEIADVVEGWFR